MAKITAQSPVKANHKTFGDDEDVFHTADEGNSESEEEEKDESESASESNSEDESDSDDAPEEESISTAKHDQELRLKQQQQILQREKEQLRLKRKEEQEKFTKQQELKRLKQQQIEERNLVELKKFEKIAKERELKANVRSLEEEELEKTLSKEVSRDIKKAKLRKFKDLKEKPRKVDGLKVKILDKTNANKLLKSKINRDSILNKRKKKLNKK